MALRNQRFQISKQINELINRRIDTAGGQKPNRTEAHTQKTSNNQHENKTGITFQWLNW